MGGCVQIFLCIRRHSHWIKAYSGMIPSSLITPAVTLFPKKATFQGTEG